VVAGDRQYFETRRLTIEMMARLEDFIAGRETNEGLEAWATSVWGKTQEGPVHANRWSSSVLINLHNASARHHPRDATSPFILRAADAAAYLQRLRRGEFGGPGVLLGGIATSLEPFAEQFGLGTERHVVDGLGWFEQLQFASFGSGRTFALNRPLQHLEMHDSVATDIVVAPGGSPGEVLRDLVEALAIDRSDFVWLADAFKDVVLPEHTLWRQDDNGNRVEIQKFTGRRKAEAELGRFEALPHKQMYWLE
jgi:hypothetical protein